jgi:DNA replication protein DnaC
MSMSMVEIENALKQLRLSGVRATLETRIIESQANNLPFLETFSLVIQDELDRRRSRLLERRYQLSGLPERASLEEFDWGYNPKIPKRPCFELNTLKFITEGANALLIGPPGTGKSHVAKAVAYAATRSGYAVVYTEADDLLASVTPPVTAADRRKILKPVLDADLLILDDLFMARKIAIDSADDLQSILHKRYKRNLSTVITSNRPVGDWGKYLGDTALASTLLDRLMHRSRLLEFVGRSYRLKEASLRIAQEQKSG